MMKKLFREAIKNNGMALQSASDRLKNKRKFVLEAISQFPNLIERKHIISEKWLKDLEVLKVVAKKTKFTDHFKINISDKNIINELAKVNGYIIYHFEDNLIDKDIIKTALLQNGMVIRGLSEKFKNDKELGLIAVKEE